MRAGKQGFLRIEKASGGKPRVSTISFLLSAHKGIAVYGDWWGGGGGGQG